MKKPLFILIILSALMSSACFGKNGFITRTWENINTPPLSLFHRPDFHACGILPKESVEQITGEKISDAELKIFSAGDDGFPAHSQCTYTLSDNRKIAFSVSVDDFSEAKPQLIGEIKKTAFKENLIETTEDVEEVGHTAFWATTENRTAGGKFGMLYVFKRQKIYIALKIYRFQDEADAKQKALNLAKQAMTQL